MSPAKLGFPARLQRLVAWWGEGLGSEGPQAMDFRCQATLSRVNCLKPSSAPAGAPAATSGASSHPRLLVAMTSSLPVVSLSTSSQAHA